MDLFFVQYIWQIEVLYDVNWDMTGEERMDKGENILGQLLLDVIDVMNVRDQAGMAIRHVLYSTAD